MLRHPSLCNGIITAIPSTALQCNLLHGWDLGLFVHQQTCKQLIHHIRTKGILSASWSALKQQMPSLPRELTVEGQGVHITTHFWHQHELKVTSWSTALSAKAEGPQQDNREFWIIIENSVLKSMLLDYIDVDISFIYKAQLKNWPLHRSQVSVSLWSSQPSMPELKIANMQEKYPLLKCSGAHLQSVFSIRQNNTQSPKRLSMNCQLRACSQSTVMPASYQLSLHNISPHHWLPPPPPPPYHKPQPPPLCSAGTELSRWIFGAGSR